MPFFFADSRAKPVLRASSAWALALLLAASAVMQPVWAELDAQLATHKPVAADNPAVAQEVVPPLEKRQPQMRTQALAAHDGWQLEVQAMLPFLRPVLVLDAPLADTTPRIAASPTGRTLLGQGERIHVRRAAPDRLAAPAYHVYRQAQPVKDPLTQAVLGYAAPYLGEVQRLSDAPPGWASFEIVHSVQDMRVGDYLLPVQPLLWRSWRQTPASAGLSTRIASVDASVTLNAVEKQVVLLSSGAQQGLLDGQLLDIWGQGPTALQATPNARDAEPPPATRKGRLLVFRTFQRLSYALILQSTDVIRPGDWVLAPGPGD